MTDTELALATKTGGLTLRGREMMDALGLLEAKGRGELGDDGLRAVRIVCRVARTALYSAAAFGGDELAWQNIENAEAEFLRNLAEKGGLHPDIGGMLRHCARLLDRPTTPPTAPAAHAGGEAVAFVEQTAPEGLYARFVDAGNMDTVGPGTKLFATPHPAPAAHAGGEAVACVRREALNFVSDSFLFPPHMADAGDVLLYTHPSPIPVDALLALIPESAECVSVGNYVGRVGDRRVAAVWDNCRAEMQRRITALLSGGAAREG